MSLPADQGSTSEMRRVASALATLPDYTDDDSKIENANDKKGDSDGGSSECDYSALDSETEKEDNSNERKKMDVDQEFIPRIRQYGDSTQGPFIVYLRAMKKFSLDVVRVSNDLFRKYASIKTIDPVNRDKLRIEFNSKKEANHLPFNKDFSKRFSIYVPAKKVEIDGKVVLNDHINTADILKGGQGVCNGVDQPVKVLEVERLKKKVVDDKGNASFQKTPFVRVTFEGNTLPDVLLIGRLRLPVNAFTPKIMRCTCCLMVGHTEKYCANKKRCEKCGLRHKNEEEFKECAASTFLCPNCRIFYREKTHDCPKVNMIRQNEVDKALASRESGPPEASENENAWQMNEMASRKKLRGNRPQNYKKDFPSVNAVVHKNRYNGLYVVHDDDDDSDLPEEEDDEMLEGAVGGAVSGAVGNAVDGAAGGAVGGAVGDASGVIVGGTSGATVGGATGPTAGSSSGVAVGGAIRKRKLNQNTSTNNDDAMFRWAAEYDKQNPRNATQIRQPGSERPAARTEAMETEQQSEVPEEQEAKKASYVGGFKEMVCSFFSSFNFGSGFMSFVEEIILPWIERRINEFMPKIFTFFCN